MSDIVSTERSKSVAEAAAGPLLSQSNRTCEVRAALPTQDAPDIDRHIPNLRDGLPTGKAEIACTSPFQSTTIPRYRITFIYVP